MKRPFGNATGGQAVGRSGIRRSWTGIRQTLRGMEQDRDQMASPRFRRAQPAHILPLSTS